MSSFRKSAPQKALPVHTVKNILAQTLEGLKQLHELNIIHTGLSAVTGPFALGYDPIAM